MSVALRLKSICLCSHSRRRRRARCKQGKARMRIARVLAPQRDIHGVPHGSENGGKSMGRSCTRDLMARATPAKEMTRAYARKEGTIGERSRAHMSKQALIRQRVQQTETGGRKETNTQHVKWENVDEIGWAHSCVSAGAHVRQIDRSMALAPGGQVDILQTHPTTFP
eukprot:1178777-Pleurochrysis_carterae.AAC.2